MTVRPPWMRSITTFAIAAALGFLTYLGVTTLWPGWSPDVYAGMVIALFLATSITAADAWQRRSTRTDRE
jgi:hypothetical protein